MHKVHLDLPDNWQLIAIPYGEQSPMLNHLGNQIASDDERKRFYAHDTMLVFYGLDSIAKGCREYIAAQ